MTHSKQITNALRTYGIYGIIVFATLLIAGTAHAATLYRQLDIGMTGSDVSALQTYLASDASIYPERLVTGYFGSLTSAAVARFQTKNGIAAVGRVGPITLAALNARIDATVPSASGAAPVISGTAVSASRNNATVNWNTNESSKGVVYYSASPLVTYENLNSVNVSGSTAMTDTNFRTSQSVALSGLQPNTTYYYLVYTTDQEGNVSVSWPSTFQTTN